MGTESKTSDQESSLLSDPASDLESLSDSDAPVQQQTEWLATTRERRSTAGNRMKSMLANQEPDSDLELLFAEDDNDGGFSDAVAAAGEDGSDVQMDSSSDDEDDDDANADESEGERELERQDRARRAARRKRKAQEAIPAKFRKKVRIDLKTTSAPPPPRPKKKAERTSWLPSAADPPTRASARKTTRISKEQLHLQMAEREARRLEQLAQMAKKAARIKATKKPPMTQEERLAEAAVVEKRNSRSLNRWEEAEKQREAERRAKLAALSQRTLRGAFITFWSGKGQWEDVELRSLRPYVTEVEEKPRKKKERRGDKGAGKAGGKNKERSGGDGAAEGQEKAVGVGGTGGHARTEDAVVGGRDTTRVAPGSSDGGRAGTTGHGAAATATALESNKTGEDGGGANEDEHARDVLVSRERKPSADKDPSAEEDADGGQQDGTAKEAASREAPGPASSKTEMPAPPRNAPRPDAPRPSGVLAAPVLAPPPPADTPKRSSSAADPPRRSAILVAPTISLSEPGRPSPRPEPSASVSRAETTALGPNSIPVTARQATAPDDATRTSDRGETAAPTSRDASPETPSAAAQPAPEPPRDMDATRNAIVFQNFNDNALRDRNVQTLVLFGRKMTKLARPPPAPTCAITNLPARYLDPQTGLPFHDLHAYKQLQRLHRGAYHFSRLLGAWVGTGASPARGVPDRFPDRHPSPAGAPKDKDREARSRPPPGPGPAAEPATTTTTVHAPAGPNPPGAAAERDRTSPQGPGLR